MLSHMSRCSAGVWADEARRGKETLAERLDCFREAQNKPLHVASHAAQISAVIADTAVL
jgi:hypothetical protein